MPRAIDEADVIFVVMVEIRFDQRERLRVFRDHRRERAAKWPR
jgi:hypothetical protein